MRIALTLILGLALAACGGTSPAPVAQQSIQSGGSAAAIVNTIRGQAGAAAVKRSSILDAAAKAHANDMAANNFFGHTGSNGSTVGKRAKKAGYKWCAVPKNVGKGYASQASAIEADRSCTCVNKNAVSHAEEMTLEKPKVQSSKTKFQNSTSATSQKFPTRFV